MFYYKGASILLVVLFAASGLAFVIEPIGHHEQENANISSSLPIVSVPSLRQEDEDLDEGADAVTEGGSAVSPGLFANAINTLTGAAGAPNPVINNPSSNAIVNVQSLLGQVIGGQDVGLILNAVGIKRPPPGANTPFNNLVSGLVAPKPTAGYTQAQINDAYAKQVQQQLQYFQHLEQLGLVNRTALVALHQQTQQQQQPQAVQEVVTVAPVESGDDEDEFIARKGAGAPALLEQPKTQHKTEIRIIIPPRVAQPQEQAQLASELQQYFRQNEQLAMGNGNDFKKRRQPEHNGNGGNHHQYSRLPYEEQEDNQEEEEDEEEDADYNKKSKKDNKHANL